MNQEANEQPNNNPPAKANPAEAASSDINQMLSSLSNAKDATAPQGSAGDLVPPAPFTPDQAAAAPEAEATAPKAEAPAPVVAKANTTEDKTTSEAKAKSEPAGEAPVKSPEMSEVEDQLHHRKTGTIKGIRDGKIQVRFAGGQLGECPADQFEKLPRVGDRVEFEVEDGAGENDTLTLNRAPEQIPAEQLQEGMIVEGFVTSMNTGGLQLRIGGRRAFMPASQIDLNHSDDLTPLINKTIECRIMQLNSKRTRIIVSRRALLEESNLEERKKRLSQLKVDQEVEGTVRKIENFGVFVQLDEVLDGLVRMADLAHHRIRSAEDVVKPGDKVKAKVLRISPNSGKLTLGIKQLTPDPWLEVETKYPVKATVKGKVSSITKFGAFVELEPGIEGLIPMAEMGWTHVHKAEDVVKMGQEIEVKVIESSAAKNRIGLSLKQMSENPWSLVAEKYPVESVVDGTVTRLTAFGAFIEIEPGIEGMCHVSQIASRRIKSPEDVLKSGEKVKAKVFEIDSDQQRMSLSIRAVTDPKGAEEVRSGGNRKAEASRSEIRKHVKSAKQAKAMQSLMGKFGDGGDLKGGIG